LQAERGDALRIEAFIKRLQRKDKEALIADPQVLGTRLYEEFGRTFNIDPVLNR
jgi:predicted GIY-YIG superfamily endonuclease